VSFFEPARQFFLSWRVAVIGFCCVFLANLQILFLLFFFTLFFSLFFSLYFSFLVAIFFFFFFFFFFPPFLSDIYFS